MKKFNVIVMALALFVSVSVASCGAQADQSSETTVDTVAVDGKCGEGKCGEGKCGGDKKDSAALAVDSAAVEVADSTSVE